MNPIQLLYTSSLKGKDESVLQPILESARRHNAVTGITGMLLYCEGSFLQVLEGPQTVVHATYERIRVDPRHCSIFKIDQIAVDKRHFSEWTMGFAPLALSDLRTFPELASAFKASDQEVASRVNSGTARKVLQLYLGGAFRLR
jgi:hypothetical protein